MLYAKVNKENGAVEFVKEECLIGELASYYEILEYISMGFNLDNGLISSNEGVIGISGECSEEIELVLKY